MRCFCSALFRSANIGTINASFETIFTFSLRTDTIQETLRNFHDFTSSFHERGGFGLTKWISNSPEILNDIPVDQRALSPVTSQNPNKIVGVDWRFSADELELSPAKLISQFQAKPTQRSSPRNILRVRPFRKRRDRNNLFSHNPTNYLA